VAEPTPEQAVRALTLQIPYYVEQVQTATGAWEGDLYAFVLAVGGDMTYAGPGASSAPLGVPDGPLRAGGTRFELWQKALEHVLEILGDPESFFRTGFDNQALGAAVGEFFHEPVGLGESRDGGSRS
jgi:hypothetical protein